VNGKASQVTGWNVAARAWRQAGLVLLIDSSARNSLGSQFSEIEHFINDLPPNVKAGIAYMQNGQAVFAGSLSTDHARVLSALHLPGVRRVRARAPTSASRTLPSTGLQAIVRPGAKW